MLPYIRAPIAHFDRRSYLKVICSSRISLLVAAVGTKLIFGLTRAKPTMWNRKTSRTLSWTMAMVSSQSLVRLGPAGVCVASSIFLSSSGMQCDEVCALQPYLGVMVKTGSPTLLSCMWPSNKGPRSLSLASASGVSGPLLGWALWLFHTLTSTIFSFTFRPTAVYMARMDSQVSVVFSHWLMRHTNSIGVSTFTPAALASASSFLALAGLYSKRCLSSAWLCPAMRGITICVAIMACLGMIAPCR